MLLNLDDDPFSSGAQGVVESGIQCTIAGDGPADTNNGNNERGCAKDEDGDLAARARQQRLDPLAAKFVTERHGYFPFGASARR